MIIVTMMPIRALTGTFFSIAGRSYGTCPSLRSFCTIRKVTGRGSAVNCSPDPCSGRGQQPAALVAETPGQSAYQPVPEPEPLDPAAMLDRHDRADQGLGRDQGIQHRAAIALEHECGAVTGQTPVDQDAAITIAVRPNAARHRTGGGHDLDPGPG